MGFIFMDCVAHNVTIWARVGNFARKRTYNSEREVCAAVGVITADASTIGLMLRIFD